MHLHCLFIETGNLFQNVIGRVGLEERLQVFVVHINELQNRSIKIQINASLNSACSIARHTTIPIC